LDENDSLFKKGIYSIPLLDEIKIVEVFLYNFFISLVDTNGTIFES